MIVWLSRVNEELDKMGCGGEWGGPNQQQGLWEHKTQQSNQGGKEKGQSNSFHVKLMLLWSIGIKRKRKGS